MPVLALLFAFLTMVVSGSAHAASPAMTVSITLTAANGWYAKDLFVFTRDASGAITSQTVLATYNFGVATAGMNAPSQPVSVPAAASWGIGQRVWTRDDKTRNGTPTVSYSDMPGLRALQSTGDCFQGGRRDSWGDAGAPGQNLVYGLTCTAVSTGTGTGAGPTGGGGTDAALNLSAGTGAATLRASHSGLCLASPVGNGESGARITQQVCGAGKEQVWEARGATGGSMLVNRANGKCLDVYGANNANNTAIIQWSCTGAANQIWSAARQGSGYRLISAASGKCVDVGGVAMNAGATINIWDCAAAPQQTFAFNTVAGTGTNTGTDTGTGTAGGTATRVSLTPTAANGWYAKDLFVFTRDANGGIASLTTVLSYNFGVTPAGLNTPSQAIDVPAGTAWGIGQRVWQRDDKTRNGTPALYYSDTPNQAALQSSGDCSQGGRRDSWGDAGSAGQNLVYTLTCATAAPDTTLGTGAGTGTGTGTGTDTGTGADAGGATPPGERAPTGASVVINRRSGNCLSVNGNAVVQQPCNDQPSQNWTFVPGSNGYQLKSATTGQCVAVENAAMGNGARTVLQGCGSAANGLWTLRKLDKWLEVVANHSSRCVSPYGGNGSRDPGAPIVQWDCDTADPQRWTILGPTERAPSSWTAPKAIGIVPVSGVPLPNGKVLFWAAEERNSFNNGNGTWTTLYDPATGASTDSYIANTGHDMFCPGTNLLPDGRLLITGGISAGNTTIYDPATNTWSKAANMNITRGYNASTTLSTGESFTYGGSWSGGAGGKDAEIWNQSTNRWRVLRNVQGAAAAQPGVPIYPGDTHYWLFAASKGAIFHAGPSVGMNWIDTNGNGSITAAGQRPGDAFAVNGTATMYDVGKILKLGGAPAYTGEPALDTGYTIDITAGPGIAPKVAASAPLLFPRAYMNSVVLPNGEVVTTGGQIVAAQFTDNLSVMTPEIWSPATGKVRRLAPMGVPRNYHSIALLLPDARVLTGGGGLCGGCGGADHLNIEILTPPYLYDTQGNLAARPTIATAPATATLGATVGVTTDRAVASFALVRVGSVTHSVNNDQRRVPVAIAGSSGTTYQLRLSEDPGILLPGSWMLFAMDANGVPSVAKYIRIR